MGWPRNLPKLAGPMEPSWRRCVVPLKWSMYEYDVSRPFTVTRVILDCLEWARNMLMLGVEEDVWCFGNRTGVTCNVVVPTIERCPKEMPVKCNSVLITVHRLSANMV